MRSNIARTWPSSRVPVRALALPIRALRLLAAQLRQEVDHGGLLLFRQAGERWHRRGRVLERAEDRRLWQLLADVGQVWSWPVVAVVPDLVAGEASGLGDDELARLVLRRDLHVDLVRRAGRRAQVGEVAH